MLEGTDICMHATHMYVCVCVCMCVCVRRVVTILDTSHLVVMQFPVDMSNTSTPLGNRETKYKEHHVQCVV